MAQRHGARQQKKVAKQKAKRAEKRADLARRDSTDPNVRLQRVATLPIVSALASATMCDQGLGTLTIARQQAGGQLIVGVYLVDLLCLGVKNAFWRPMTPGEYKELVQRIEEQEPMRTVAPAYVVKVINGAVEFARAFGFRPHHDFRHASRLLEGIDPSECPEEFVFGRNGKPMYVQGPNESPMEVKAIADQVLKASGDFFLPRPEVLESAQLALDEVPAADRTWVDERDALEERS